MTTKNPKDPARSAKTSPATKPADADDKTAKDGAAVTRKSPASATKGTAKEPTQRSKASTPGDDRERRSSPSTKGTGAAAKTEGQDSTAKRTEPEPTPEPKRAVQPAEAAVTRPAANVDAANGVQARPTSRMQSSAADTALVQPPGTSAPIAASEKPAAEPLTAAPDKAQEPKRELGAGHETGSAPGDTFDAPPAGTSAASEPEIVAPAQEPAIEPQSAEAPPPEPSAAPEPEYIPSPEPEPEPPPQPHRPSMFIVHITPELAPVAKVGGLADVVFGLAKEQEIRGNHVEVILPKYDSLRYDQIWGLTETFNDLWVPWYGGAIHCTVYFGFAHGRKCFFIEPHSADNFFNRGCIYGFNDDILRFAFFSRAALEFLWKSGKHPDIIHCHDWQTALVPVFLYEIYQHLGMTHPRVCFTIHNFKHQGVTGANLLHATGLNRPEYYFHYDRLRDNHNVHALNLMKGGIVYSNFITTVSPRHAVEAKDHGEGFGLEPTLHIHHQKYGGVLNGIDYEAWNPELDPYLPFRYNVDRLDDKYKNKIALRDRLLLADNEKPIVAFIGRLDPQKGLELIRHALFYTLHRNGQFVLLGSSPDSQINNYFWGLKHQLNENADCHLEIGFNEELSHLIYAGADIVVVPSRFEPCGLTQMIAMRYGAIPVVREVGGLADTVFDKDYSHRALHERNGYMFRDYDFGGLESALGRALSCYYEFPEHFRELMKNAMRYDYSWNYPGQHYMNIYDYIREK